MISVTRHGVLLRKTTLGFEEHGVLNPATISDDNIVHLLYRAVDQAGISSIGYCRLDGPLNIAARDIEPLLSPMFDYEVQGLEDPRVVRIDELYHVSYTAYDGVNAMGALATSKDLVHFERHGLIVPCFSYEEMKELIQSTVDLNEKYKRYNSHNESWTTTGVKKLVWDKNVVFFPRRIHGQLWFLHRIKPDIQIAHVDQISDLTTGFWSKYLESLQEHIALAPRHDHEVSYIGAGCPPIETESGWLIIYHGVHDTNDGYVYSACAALLRLENPLEELARLPYPLFVPEHAWELRGEVNNVVFPTGTAVFDDTLYIYYGAADEQIGCASLSLSGLISELKGYINHTP